MRSALVFAATAAILLVACGDAAGQNGEASGQGPGGAALETRAANASYRPAFPGQTRAPAARSEVAFTVETVAGGLVQPWAVEPLADGRFLVTEKPGRMRIVSPTGQVSEPIAGVPAVDSGGQGGLLDVALSPTFAQDRMIYWSYTEPRDGGGNGTSVARGRLVEAGGQARLEGVQVIFRAVPPYANNMHYGSRLAFAPDGKLFITLGERSDAETRGQAQELGSHYGKVIRINADGSVPSDNPFVNRAGARPEIWSWGHRNVQSAAIDPSSGRLWTVEHGPRGGDELNQPQAGRNYGWPVITYGLEYAGGAVGEGITAREGMEQPVYYWDPVIAPSGMQFYTGDAFPAWRGSVFIGGLKDMDLVRVVLRDGRVVGEERLLADRKKRIRDVRQGPDGLLYVLTNVRGGDGVGELWRLRPSGG